MTILISFPIYSASIAELTAAEVAILDSNHEPALPAAELSFEQNGGNSRWCAASFFISGPVTNDLHKRFPRIAFNKNYCRCLVAWRLVEKGMMYAKIIKFGKLLIIFPAE